MREQPNQADLLAIARQVLKEQIIPHLPKDQVYNGLMIANAMAIAARQYSDGGLAAEWSALSAVLAACGQQPSANEDNLHTAVTQGSQRVIEAIRCGEFDHSAEVDTKKQALLQDYLSLQVLQRVKESNPKALP